MTDEPHAREVVAGGTVVRPGLGRLRYFATRFEGVRVEGLSRMREWVSFQGCEFAECDFVDCDLDGSFCGALADPAAASTFTGCRFVRCRLADAYLGGARLERCVFEDCDFDGVFFVSTDLVENRFVGLVKSLSIAARSSEYSAPPPNHKVKLPPRENEVRGNDFTAAELQGLGLREGVRVDLQSWPSGPEYVVVDRLPLRLAAARAALPAPVTVADRTVALMLEDEARGQEQKVYRLDDPVMGPTHNTMVRLLLQARVAD